MMLSAFTATTAPSRVDWRSERDRIDLAAMATELLGPPPGRRGEGRRLFWFCPFHDDANPSLLVDPDKWRCKCYGCDAHGDAAALLMKLDGLNFPEAIRRLVGGDLGATTYRSSPQPARPPKVDGPRGLAADAAQALIESAEAHLRSPEGPRRGPN